MQPPCRQRQTPSSSLSSLQVHFILVTITVMAGLMVRQQSGIACSSALLQPTPAPASTRALRGMAPTLLLNATVMHYCAQGKHTSFTPAFMPFYAGTVRSSSNSTVKVLSVNTHASSDTAVGATPQTCFGPGASVYDESHHKLNRGYGTVAAQMAAASRC